MKKKSMRFVAAMIAAAIMVILAACGEKDTPVNDLSSAETASAESVAGSSSGQEGASVTSLPAQSQESGSSNIASKEPPAPAVSSQPAISSTPPQNPASSGKKPTVPPAVDAGKPVKVDAVTWEDGDYIYKYGMEYDNSMGQWFENDADGFGVKVKDKTKKTYGPIAEQIDGKPIRKLYSTFSGCTALTIAPAIPSGVVDLTSAFQGCVSLTAAPAIPSGVVDLTSTFQGCSSLTAAPAIPNGVAYMISTFAYCSSLKTPPVIPSSVGLLNSAFRECKALTAAPVIPGNVSSIEETFYNCTSLTKAPVIPKNVTIMDYTFYGCTSLSGTITIHTSPQRATYYAACLYKTKITAVEGETTLAKEILETVSKE